MARPAHRRPRGARVAAAGLAGVALLAAGCGWDDGVDSRSATAGLPSTRADVESQDWELDADDSSVAVAPGAVVTLAVDGDVVSGSAGCNAYRGTISFADGVEVTDVALTRRACDEAIMRTEQEFVAALESVDDVDVDVDDDGEADRLVLTGDDARLAFSAYDAGELLVGAWEVVSLATGDAVETVLAGTTPTVTFAAGGDVTLDAGCNSLGSTWTLDGHDLTIDPVRSTMMACEEPEGVMDQEAALAAALGSAARVEIAPGSLTVLDGDGRIALVAVRDEP